MIKRRSKRRFAFVVPTLSEASAQNEDIVQLLLFAAMRIDQQLASKTSRSFATTIISVDHDISGWKHVSSLFSKEALKHILIEELKEPATPNLAIAGHKPAYNLFEFLKDRVFDEVHCLDRWGLAYYPTQAKYLGLYFLNTFFAVHVVGSTLFREDAKDNIIDDIGWLMQDLLERGSIERADAVFVHDSKAWRWYSDKIENYSQASVYDLAWTKGNHHPTKLTPNDTDTAVAIIFYGPLGVDGGLPLFCDVVDHALPEIESSVEIFFVGSPQPISGMDAVSYIRVRSAKWGIPVTIRRDLTISHEIDFICDLHGVVYCDTVRRDGLRARLLTSSSLQLLSVREIPIVRKRHNRSPDLNSPGSLAQALIKLLAAPTVKCPQGVPSLTELWNAGRSSLADLEDFAPSPPLQVKRGNQPKVSVCLTHYCRLNKLRSALASLRLQDYKNFEVIVIDDGSPKPEVQSELEKIKREIEPLGWRLVVQENRYLGAARNLGASYAYGEYLMFMDDDNIAKPNEISTFVAVAQRTGADIVTAFCDVFQDDSDLKAITPPKMRFTPFGSDPAIGVFSNCYGDANALYSRKAFNKLGGFTEDYGVTHEDWELFCRASLEGVKLICVPEPLFWYRLDDNGMFLGQRTQLHKTTNLRRHIRPYIEKLPYFQVKLLQLAQGLHVSRPTINDKHGLEEIPTTVVACTRAAVPKIAKNVQERVPFARVAIIMRTKDRPVLLRRAIRSVLDQTFKDWLLVIVNDGGDPKSIDLVVDEVAEELYRRLLVLHHPVSFGMQSAANVGISNCDSDFITVHDDDDTWEPTFLAHTVSHLDERGWDPKLGGVVTWTQVIIEELSRDGEISIHDRFIFDDKLRGISLRDLSVENRFPPISFLFRRAALDAVGPFKEQHGPLGDWEFHIRLLQRFNIEVICESLANYHHRLNTMTGVYSNSVHSQNNLHQSKRVDLLNSVLREELTGENGISLAELLALGDLQSVMLDEQRKEFKRLHDYIWTVEQNIKFIASHFGASTGASYKRNFVINGDFRLWPGPGRITRRPGDKHAFSKICDGFYVCYDGRQVSYRVEQHKWTEDGKQLPYGKTYLHIESDGDSKGGSWVVLDFIIPSVLQVSGQNICISGISSLRGTQDRIFVGGRYKLGGGQELNWPDVMVSLTSEFTQWSCSISCPSVQKTEVSRGHNSRILLKIPHDQAFEFDLTNFQVELGTAPTEFEYNGTNSLRDRLAILWHKSGSWLRNDQKYIDGHLK